jgi:hypothetical protein
MSGVTAIQGVDDILRKLATDAVASLSPKPDITVGPLDSDADGLRLNWFLYRISPDVAYRNMEPPQAGGWQTARGNPPLALRLSYLLTAFPATVVNGGDQEQFAHAGLTAVMRAVHENAIVGEGSPVLTPALAALVRPLIEPLRIVLDDLDLESVTKTWTAASQPLRLSVGYQVSVVIVQTAETFQAGPPVRVVRIAVPPTMGPRFVAIVPARASVGDELDVEVEGLTSGATFMLAHEQHDPTGLDWTMDVLPGAAPGHVKLALPDPRIAPGLRRLDAVETDSGLPVGRDSIGLTVVPAVTGPSTALPRNTPVSLDTVHAAGDVEVFLGGVRLDQVTFVSPTDVRITIPPATSPGPAAVALRAGKVAGPTRSVVVA